MLRHHVVGQRADQVGRRRVGQFASGGVGPRCHARVDAGALGVGRLGRWVGSLRRGGHRAVRHALLRRAADRAVRRLLQDGGRVGQAARRGPLHMQPGTGARHATTHHAGSGAVDVILHSLVAGHGLPGAVPLKGRLRQLRAAADRALFQHFLAGSLGTSPQHALARAFRDLHAACSSAKIEPVSERVHGTSGQCGTTHARQITTRQRPVFALRLAQCFGVDRAQFLACVERTTSNRCTSFRAEPLLHGRLGGGLGGLLGQALLGHQFGGLLQHHALDHRPRDKPRRRASDVAHPGHLGARQCACTHHGRAFQQLATHVARVVLQVVAQVAGVLQHMGKAVARLAQLLRVAFVALVHVQAVVLYRIADGTIAAQCLAGAGGNVAAKGHRTTSQLRQLVRGRLESAHEIAGVGIWVLQHGSRLGGRRVELVKDIASGGTGCGVELIEYVGHGLPPQQSSGGTRPVFLIELLLVLRVLFQELRRLRGRAYACRRLGRLPATQLLQHLRRLLHGRKSLLASDWLRILAIT
ncbi:hypothetical protein [Rhodanobacter lindaniclasticus]